MAMHVRRPGTALLFVGIRRGLGAARRAVRGRPSRSGRVAARPLAGVRLRRTASRGHQMSGRRWQLRLPRDHGRGGRRWKRCSTGAATEEDVAGGVNALIDLPVRPRSGNGEHSWTIGFRVRAQPSCPQPSRAYSAVPKKHGTSGPSSRGVLAARTVTFFADGARAWRYGTWFGAQSIQHRAAGSKDVGNPVGLTVAIERRASFAATDIDFDPGFLHAFSCSMKRASPARSADPRTCRIRRCETPRPAAVRPG